MPKSVSVDASVDAESTVQHPRLLSLEDGKTVLFFLNNYNFKSNFFFSLLFNFWHIYKDIVNQTEEFIYLICICFLSVVENFSFQPPVRLYLPLEYFFHLLSKSLTQDFRFLINFSFFFISLFEPRLA